MTFRGGDESDQEVRERARARRREQLDAPAAPSPLAVPKKQPTIGPSAGRLEPIGKEHPTIGPPPRTVSGGPTVTQKPEDNKVFQVLNDGEFDEKVLFWNRQSFGVGDEINATLRDKSHPYTILSQIPIEGSDLFAYEVERADVFRPLQFDPAQQEATTDEYFKFTEILDSAATLEEHPPQGMENIVPVKPPILTGTPTVTFDASSNEFIVYKNLESYNSFMDDQHPDAVEALTAAQRKTSPEARAAAGTLNPLSSLTLALAQIEDEHPDDFTEFLSSEAGLNDLWSKSFGQFISVPPPVVTLSLKHPGVFVAAIEEAFVPDVKFLKDALQKTTELVLDPIFIGTMALFPLGAGVSKTRTGIRLALEIGAGEAGAEEVGLPAIAGAVAGPLALGPAIRGFTRGVYRSALQKARVNPKTGEPATELLRLQGELPNPVEVVGPDGVKIGEAALSPAEVQAGRHTLLATGPEGAEVGRLQWRSPGHIVDVVSQTEGKGVGSSLMEQALGDIAASGAKTVTGDLNSEAGVRLFNRFKAKFTTLSGKKLSTEEAIATAKANQGPIGTIELDSQLAARLTYKRALRSAVPNVPQVAGASEGATVELLEQVIEANITRPAAQDWLRKLAGSMEHIPGARQIVRALNISSIADDPIIQGGFGWQAVKDVDDAARVLSMASFRGSRLPFTQNHLAQIWVPNVPAATRLERGAQIVPRAFGKGGEWIAFGDVFESVMAGEARYLNRLAPEQISWMNRANTVLNQYVGHLESVLGETVKKRAAWWPRFIVNPSKKQFTVSSGPGKVPAFFGRVVEEQQKAIQELGLRYRPDVLTQMDDAIAGFQRVGRDKILADWLKKQGVIRMGAKTLEKVPAEGVSPFARGIIQQDDLTQLNALIRSPSLTNPGIAAGTKPFRAINNIARLVLTGTVDTGWGAIQLQTLAAVNPALWGEAMGRGFWNMMVEPKQIYRFMTTSKGAARYATYGGNVGLETEFFQATRMAGIPRLPGVAQPALDLATLPIRTFINRLQTGFESTLLYSRILAFDSMYEVATTAGKGTVNRVLARASGAPAELTGREFHNEMFRLARFTDTLIGQPKLGGIITGSQAQVESAFVWFATRYTRSVFGTISYAFGKGYTPAQARTILAKMMLGGAATYAGLAAGIGKAQGLSDDQIQKNITTGLNPLSGKQFMSFKMGDAWYGLGGAYRSMMAFFVGLGDKKNWEFEEWESALWDNPFVKGLRSRTSPTTGTFMDFMEGEDFLGFPISVADMVDEPEKFLDYAIDKFAPITMDALVQDMEWRVNTPRFIAEFFGLRTSPETRFEAETGVMNRISNDLYGAPYDSLEHNLLAQDIIRSHPDVKRAAEGLFGVIRERERDAKFRLWDEGRAEIRGRYGEEKLDLDEAVTGINIARQPSMDSWFKHAATIPPSARLNGRDYLEQYSDTVSAQFHELEGLKTGFGFEFEDEEAPEGTVNFIMNQFFDLDLEDYIDKESLQPDWETWFADRDAVLEQLPDRWKPVAEEFLHKNETPTRRSFREAFESVITPSGYFRTRELIAESFDISLNALEDDIIADFTSRGQRAAPNDVGSEVDQVLNALMKITFGDSIPSMSKMRQLLREINPRLDVELYRHGYVSSVRSQAAVDLSVEMMEHREPRKGYFKPKLAADVRKKIRRALR